ncbi:MAG: 4Fe-4S dicluster domain-containing protein [Thermodesulfobacteriota bacterium]
MTEDNKNHGKSHGRDYGIQTTSGLGVEGRKRYAMVIDLRKCTGCGSCVVACKSEHDVPLGVWRMWLKTEDKGTYPDVKRTFLPRLCNHCEYPICVRNCPTQATFKHEDGFVLQRFNRCIGCRTCVIACPYNARHLLPNHRTDEKQPVGVVDKCDYCIHRVKRGLVPTCVSTCVGGAFTFGDLNDPKSEVSKLVKKNSVMTLKPEIGTHPQTYYIGLDEGIADQVASYRHRSAQMKEEYNTFKKNHEGFHGDLTEGGSHIVVQVVRNFLGFLKEIPAKAGRVLGLGG